MLVGEIIIGVGLGALAFMLLFIFVAYAAWCMEMDKYRCEEND